MEKVETPRRRSGRPRATELGERADALLAVTEALLIERGYEKTTLNVVAKHAGVSKQTIYVKYGGKPGLLRAVLQRMSKQSVRDALSRDDELPLYEGLVERVRSLLHLNNSEGAIAITTISEREARNFPEFHEEMLKAKERDLLQPLSAYFERLKRRGLVKDIDCDRIASMLLWQASEDLVATAATGRRRNDEPEAIEEKARFIARFFADAIRPA